eukprot:CAMPEP_0179073810 /NCGR_PEP_ID=MMETSP0796-20121207/32764_1 /TAXON_ID=73915 /ORGANISM="Pyrodinium bahamense, Strain pbaha01" /LENGTH=151 /DNA_ID=CAMNT_0020771017 /DNA_START=108 /DNA_END=564 /DNA_ORIENTATION=-
MSIAGIASGLHTEPPTQDETLSGSTDTTVSSMDQAWYQFDVIRGAVIRDLVLHRLIELVKLSVAETRAQACQRLQPWSRRLSDSEEERTEYPSVSARAITHANNNGVYRITEARLQVILFQLQPRRGAAVGHVFAAEILDDQSLRAVLYRL